MTKELDRADLFTRMLRMRRFEETVLHLAPEHPYIGRQHLYIGAEASGAATASVLDSADLSHTTHRNHGFIIARGADPGRAFAEILGRKDGLNRGRGGPWHLCDKAAGFQSTSAMVGGSVGLAVGAAFALQRQNKDAISVAHFGDGTLDEGITYEALNLASLFSLPILFLCENNSKAGQRPSSMLAAKKLRDVPEALSIPTVLVDGADAEAMFAAVTEAVGTIRQGNGPVFIEATLERWPGSHQTGFGFPTGITDVAMAWDGDKIAGDHADWVRKYDPIRRYGAALVSGGHLSKDEILAIDHKINDEIAAARAFAEASPFPEAATAGDGVFA